MENNNMDWNTSINENESIIEAEIMNETDNVLHGILIFNIDNFVKVNEMFGRSNGDQILQIIKENTNRLFRGSDIILQIRGDEFLVYNRNIGEINNAEILAEKLLTAISSICVNDTFHLTASVGISIYPFHGKNYQELKNKAYQAMYRAKANGKNGFRLYDAARTKKRYHELKYQNDFKYDTYDEDLIYNIRDKRFIDTAIQILYEDKDIFSGINSILELMCIYLGFSRTYIFTQEKHSLYEEQKMQYCIPGYEIGKESDVLRQIKGDLLCRLYENYHDLKLIHESIPSLEPNVEKYMEEQKIKDLLFYPLIKGEQYIGALVFENMTSNVIDFDKDALQLLKNQLHIIQSYIFNIYPKKKNKEYIVKLELFDNIDAYTYIVDSNTYEIDFLNRKALFCNESNKLGEKCYEIFRNSDHPCDDCPMKKMDVDEPHACANGEFFNYSVRKWTKNLYSWLDTRENSGKCIVISVDINEFFEE